MTGFPASDRSEADAARATPESATRALLVAMAHEDAAAIRAVTLPLPEDDLRLLASMEQDSSISEAAREQIHLKAAAGPVFLLDSAAADPVRRGMIVLRSILIRCGFLPCDGFRMNRPPVLPPVRGILSAVKAATVKADLPPNTVLIGAPPFALLVHKGADGWRVDARPIVFSSRPVEAVSPRDDAARPDGGSG